MQLGFVLVKITSISFATLGGLLLFDKSNYLSDVLKLLLLTTAALIVSIIYLVKANNEIKNLSSAKNELENINKKLETTNKNLNNIISIKNQDINKKDEKLLQSFQQYNDKINYITSLIINSTRETSVKDRRKLFEIYHTILEYIHK